MRSEPESADSRGRERPSGLARPLPGWAAAQAERSASWWPSRTPREHAHRRIQAHVCSRLPTQCRTDAGAGHVLGLTVASASAATATVVASAALDLGKAHWGAALVALPLLVAVFLAAWLSYRRLLPAASVALALLVVTIATGGVVGWAGEARWAVALHVAASSITLAATLVLLALAHRGERAPVAPLRDYVTLTKPRIMSLLLVTGAAGMFVGAGGVPPVADLLVTMLGLGLACGGASALNHVIDADIDRLMGARTKARPVASGRLAPARGLEFGLALSGASFALLASSINVVTALLALAGNLFYVLVYTSWLKRTTDWNIVIGGAAGAVPPLVGFAAATGDLTLPSLWLFLIVFLWTPPHFWALALLIKDNYVAANVPMLPGTRGDRETTRQILLYTLVMVAFTVAVGWWLGLLYTVAALVLGGAFFVLAWRLRRYGTRGHAIALFHYSLAYLALLFVAAALDPVIL